MTHPRRRAPAIALLFLLCHALSAWAALPAPTVVAPAAGASLTQPIKLDWNAVSDPAGPIGSYTWQVATTSAFTTIVLAGFTNNLSDSIPTATEDTVSGLPNGTYFWRVKATQLVGGVVFSVDSPWSATRTFTVNGLGPAPAGVPSFTTPAAGVQFHVREFFDIKWSAVPGAQYYLLEVDDDPAFSYPLTLTTTALIFGTHVQAGWGNALSNVYYRVRAVSSDNVRGLPSTTLNVHVTDAAPVPPAPSQVAPAGGATVSIPFTFDWTDTPNPQVVGYDVDIDTDPTFSGVSGVLFLQGVSRSDYMVASDLPPGRYFWRVRALHGDVAGPWSPGRAITVVAAPPPIPDQGLFAIITGPNSAYGGNSTQARVLLNSPAPPGGVVVTLASDMPQAQVPGTVIVPAGKTDATLSPITTGPVPPNGIIGIIRAAYNGAWQQSSLGVMPLLYGTGLSNEAVVGGTSFTGTVTLQSAAPPGGTTVRLISSDTALARPPASVFIPAGATDATFAVPTSPVTVATRIVIETGTDVDGYRAPQAWITLLPPGSPEPAPSLSTLTLNPSSAIVGATSTATVTLTAPAPAGGATVTLNGSMEGQVITPPSVVVPAGSTSATFMMTAPQVTAPHWVMIQAHYGTSGGSQARLLEVDPGPGPATLLAMNANSGDVIGGQSLRGTVALAIPAPVGGGVVALSSDNPGVAQVPANVSVNEGNSAASFPITTSPVPVTSGARITATAGGVSKSWFVNVAPNPNAPPLLQSLAFNPTSVAGGTVATGTITLSAPAPTGGITVTLATSNPAVATPPPVVSIGAGQTSATFAMTTFAVSSSTTVSISALFDTTRVATLTVTPGTTTPPAPSLSALTLSPTSVVGGASAQGTVTLSSAAPTGGVIVALSSSNSAVATAPASVGVAAGARSATFTVASRSVGAQSSAVISATYNSTSRSATLTVNPAGGGPLAAPSLVTPASDARFPPGQGITFDWSDVAGAATYTVQIDDQNSFPAPLIVNQIVPTSQYLANGLPTKTMWWRVRANDASGNPGAWSAARRFEVKN